MACPDTKRLLLPILLLLLFAFPLSVIAASLRHCDFPAMFNFGDSNSDTGGLSAAFGPAPEPNGETYFGKPSGRYSDGRLIVDFMAERLGLPHLCAYLDSVGTNFTHGANFATAGSTIRKQSTTLFQSGFSPFSLDVQTWQFTQFINRSQSVYNKGGVYQGLLPEHDYFSRALYTIDIGQNDLTAGLFNNLTTEEVKATIPDILAKYVEDISSIYGQGGRTFWIHNTGPLGCLPYVLDRVPITAGQIDKFGCGTPFNEVAKLFNSKLKDTVAQLRKDFPDAAFTYVNVYSVKYALITNAKKFGFEHPLMACCGHGGKYNYNINHGCGSKIVVDGKQVLLGKSCGNPSKRINWDGVHYTEAANKWVFEQIYRGKFSDPPLPVSLACNKQARRG